MNSLSNEDNSLDQTTDMSLEKKGKEVDDALLSPEEENAADEAESEMKKQLTVLGEAGQSTETEHANAEKQQIAMFSTRSTADNWTFIVEEMEKLCLARNYQSVRELAEHVAHVKTHFDAVAQSTETNDKSHEIEHAFALHITQYLSKVQRRVNSVHTQLLVLSGRNQADPSHTGTSTGKRSYSQYSDADLKMDVPFLPNRLESGTLGAVEYREELKSLGNNDRPIGNYDKLEEKHKSSLRSFSHSLEICVQRANVFNDKPDKKMYKETLSTLDSILRGTRTLKENSDDLCKLSIPGPLAAEETFAQPYLLAVLQALGSMIDSARVDGSPAKTMVQTNRIVPKTQSRSKRVADKSIAANSRFIFMLRDDSVEIPVEEKPGERQGIKPEQLCHECTDQALSHLAKQVGIAFNFAGIGIDARATGVVLTAAYVKIVQLRLEDMGTPNMKLIQLETKPMPLLSKMSFEKWVKGRESLWEAVKRDLYGDGIPANGDSSTALVPSGLVALWNLMTTSRSVLVGPSRLSSNELGELIGFGSSATVHEAKDNAKHVIKLSRYGAKAALAKDLSFTIGGIKVQLPALILAPHGISVEMHLAQIEGDGKNELLTIGKDLMSALSFIHRKGYNHNDVSPKNILFDQTTGKAFLIDFGLASSHSHEINGFRGTPRYAHREVFQMYPNRKWKSKPVYDKTSLALCMAVLSNQGKHFWKSFRPCNITGRENAERKKEFDSWAEKRSRCAWSRLQEIGFTGDWESLC